MNETRLARQAQPNCFRRSKKRIQPHGRTIRTGLNRARREARISAWQVEPLAGLPRPWHVSVDRSGCVSGCSLRPSPQDNAWVCRCGCRAVPCPHFLHGAGASASAQPGTVGRTWARDDSSKNSPPSALMQPPSNSAAENHAVTVFSRWRRENHRGFNAGQEASYQSPSTNSSSPHKAVAK